MERLTEILPMLALAVSLVVMLAGLTFVVVAFRYKTDKHPPIASVNPKHWIPIWKMQDWFTPRGYRYNLTGWALFSVGCLCQVFYYLSR